MVMINLFIYIEWSRNWQCLLFS